MPSKMNPVPPVMHAYMVESPVRVGPYSKEFINFRCNRLIRCSNSANHA
jgi:hypothetical protein